MASAANPTFQYDVSEVAGVKVANREVEGPTGTLALVAKAGSRYQPFPGFSDALEKFAFKVGLHKHPLMVLSPVFQANTTIGSPHSSVRHCGLLERSSCWVVRSRQHTRAKMSSSVPNSFRTIFHTSQSFWRRSQASPSLLVSWLPWPVAKEGEEGPPIQVG